MRHGRAQQTAATLHVVAWQHIIVWAAPEGKCLVVVVLEDLGVPTAKAQLDIAGIALHASLRLLTALPTDDSLGGLMAW
jgi:hypothetical protein